MSGACEIKLVAVGDGAVGKTCLLNSFVNDSFPEQYEPTIFENFAFEVDKKLEIGELEGKKAVAQLWDTAGQEGFERIRILSYENTNCFIVCFSVADMVTFDNVGYKWLEELRQHRPEAKILLVGTKADLRNAGKENGGKKSVRMKEVPPKTIETFVKKRKLDGYVECSAKDDKESVNKVFKKAVQLGLLELGAIDSITAPDTPDGDKKSKRCVIL